MTSKNAERLIMKFVTNQADLEEISELTYWLSSNEANKKIFEDFVKTNYVADFVMADYDVESAKKVLLQKIRTTRPIAGKRNLTAYYKYAAVLVVGLMMVYWYTASQNDIQTSIVQTNQLVPKEEAITLETEDGKLQTINLNQTQNITNVSGKIVGKQNKGTLVYNGTDVGEKLVYNTLKIPYGKRFNLQLSDGTKVYLNAGTTLRFPVHFLKNQDRQVFVSGEAYFEVAKDKKHPFTVKSTKMNVEVFGTKFNVNAYPDDSKAQVVLVEGKVGLYQGTKVDNDMVFLKPGFMGTSANGQNAINSQAVFTETYTSWINGGLVFRNTSFNEIIKKLERHYNVTFINNNKTLGKEVFNARFDNESINEVLKYLDESFAIKYKIQNNKVIIQ
ncbi:FecR family protein [Flavobacterium agrisoli]|uniref:FecR family protein n=1 Tax=Flavobacterium agrisoli TaxID=2793066 RepID=A0A934PJK1_9FLAO|nr:FecR family protein [Flavobacterium agrisoli]MBK0368782.1 FecR family protein [Flavobacterium agrisoli]